VSARDAQKTEDRAALSGCLGVYTENYSELDGLLQSGRADYIDEALAQKDKSRAFIHIYVSEKAQLNKTAAFMEDGLSRENIPFSLKTRGFENEDWENSWKSFHKPLRVGERLVVCPSWENFSPEANDVKITLDPGACFGSGQDETTRLCMEMIEEIPLSGKRVLDLGCGSGILAITALLLGAEMAVATDIAPAAVSAAEENAEINEVSQRFKVFLGNILTDEKLRLAIGNGYDLIYANIAANVHVAMAGLYMSMLKKGGMLIVGGIKSPLKKKAQKALEQEGFSLVSQKEEGGWHSLCLEKS
jgi:ribosomal protein L11 methyltransferase